MQLLDIVKKGSTDRSVTIRIIDSTTWLPETAVEHNTSGIDLWYRREGAALSSITEAALTALTDAHSDGGIEHIGDGCYRLDLPDAAFASGANHVDIGGTVTGMIVIGGRVKLVNYDPEDAVRLGLTALPNAAADAAGGLVVSDAGGLDIDAKLAVATSALATPTNITAGTITTVTNLTNLPTIPANWLTAAGLATDAVAEIQSGLATASSLATVAGYLDTEIAAILADTNELQTDWANGGRLDLILDTAALGGSGGLDAAGVRAAIGLASANLDTQLATIDTNVDAVLVDTNQLQTDWANGGRLDLLLDNVLMVGIEYIHTNTTSAETANVTITKA